MEAIVGSHISNIMYTYLGVQIYAQVLFQLTERSNSGIHNILLTQHKNKIKQFDICSIRSYSSQFFFSACALAAAAMLRVERRLMVSLVRVLLATEQSSAGSDVEKRA